MGCRCTGTWLTRQSPAAKSPGTSHKGIRCGTPRIFSGVRTVLRGAIRSEDQWADWIKPGQLRWLRYQPRITDSHSRWISYPGPATFLLIVVLVQARVTKRRRR